jgi:AraC-like DNA-binding protein
MHVESAKADANTASVPLSPRIATLTDPRTPVDPAPVRSTMQQLWQDLAPSSGLRRMAVLIDEATHVGLYELRPPAFEWRSFASYDEVARWLDRPEPQPAPSPVSELRARLRKDPCASLAELARALCTSTRTLQRALADAGTTLSLERDRVRVAKVVELLRDPHAKLEAIALEIGCSDRRSLNRLFRRVTGESPAQLRARLASCAARALTGSEERTESSAHG